MRSGRINLALALLDGTAAVPAIWAASDWRWTADRQLSAAFDLPAPSWLLAFVLLWILISDRMQLSLFYPIRSELMARVVVANGIAGVCAAMLTVIFGPPLPNFNVGVFAVGFFCIVCITQLARRALYMRKHLGSGKRHRVVIVGGGVLARELAAALERDPAQRYEVAGFLAPEMEQVTGISPALNAENTITSISVPDYLAQKKIDQIYFTLPNSGDQDVLRLVAECRESGIAVSFVPHGYELFITRSVLRTVGGIPLVAVDERQTQARIPLVKTVADAAMATALLLLTAPLIGIVAAIVASTRGSALKREERCGIGGRSFKMYRFNIQRGPEGASWFERWIEIAKISELPQLWNVVRGDMSLVGPQAETAERAQYYSEWQKRSLTFRPGVTGYAQIYGLHGKSSQAEKGRYEIHYSFGWSPLLELTLVVQTLWFISRRIAIAVLFPAKSSVRTNTLPHGLEVASANGSQPSAD